MNKGHHFLEDFGVVFLSFRSLVATPGSQRQEIQTNIVFFFWHACEPMQVASGNIGPQDAVTLSLVAVFPHINQF